MNVSQIMQQLKAVSQDLWQALDRGEPLNQYDRMSLENIVTLLQLTSMEWKYRGDWDSTQHWESPVEEDGGHRHSPAKNSSETRC